MGRIAGRALVSLGDDVAGDVIESPLAGFDDVTEGLALDGVGAGDHSDEDGVGTQVGDAGEGGEVGLAIAGSGADEADGLGSGKGGGELDAGEFVHPGKVFRSENHGWKVARNGEGARVDDFRSFFGACFWECGRGKGSAFLNGYCRVPACFGCLLPVV